MRGDNEVYLNSSREIQLQLRQEYMADEIARGYPDFLAGLNLDPDALTNYPKLCNRQVVLNTFCSLRLNTFFSENRAPVFDSVAVFV